MQRNNHWILHTGVVLGLALSGCGDEPSRTDAGMEAGADGGMADAAPEASVDAGMDADSDAATMNPCTEEGWGETCGPDAWLFFTASFFPGVGTPQGWVGVVHPSDGTVTWSDAITDDTDLVAARAGCTPILLRRTTGDVAAQLDTAPTMTARSWSPAPPGTMPAMWGYNPWAIAAVNPSTAYVAPYAVNEVTLLDATCPGEMARAGAVDLSAFLSASDMDGSVDAADVLVYDGRAYVALGRSYVDADYNLQFTDGAMIAVIDTDTHELIDMDPDTDGVQGIPLGYENPVGGMAVADIDGAVLYVGAVGDHFLTEDGAIVPVTLADGSVGAPIVQEMDGETFGAFVVHETRTTMYVILKSAGAGDDPSSSVVPIDLLTGTRGTPLLTGSNATHLTLFGDKLLVVDGTNLRVFDLADGSETTPAGGVSLVPPGVDTSSGSYFVGRPVMIP